MPVQTQPGLERRTIGTAVAKPAVVRAEGDGEPRFVGHAAVFNVRTLIGQLPWGFYEEMATGAFTDTLADGGAAIGVDQAFLLDHDSRWVVSRRAAETLLLEEDATGLAVDSALDTRVTYVQDLVHNLDNRNITGMSFGFYERAGRWERLTIESEAGPIEVDLRVVTRVDLLEVSAVTFPAYTETDAGLRAVATALRRSDDDALIHRHAAGSDKLAALLDIRPSATRSLRAKSLGMRHDALAALTGLPR